jgi:NADPH:quinone reductase-like Zn-dependent oxidoreductase
VVGVAAAPANPCDGHFMRGDEVFGFVSGGGFAEYLSKPEELLARKPAKLSFQQAATVPLAALNAHQQHLSN